MEMTLFGDRETCTYTSCYCEENVWMLCSEAQKKFPDKFEHCYVVFLSNKKKMIPLWRQKACRSPDSPVIWDYHVLMIHQSGTTTRVYDLDTILQFPCYFDEYMSLAVGTDVGILSEYHRFFRVVKAEDYIAHFASDRSHMLRKDGSWMAEPPNYPPIHTTESTHNIDSFISMEPDVGWGQVLDLDAFNSRFSTETTHLPSLLRQL